MAPIIAEAKKIASKEQLLLDPSYVSMYTEYSATSVGWSHGRNHGVIVVRDVLASESVRCVKTSQGSVGGFVCGSSSFRTLAHARLLPHPLCENVRVGPGRTLRSGPIVLLSFLYP